MQTKSCRLSSGLLAALSVIVLGGIEDFRAFGFCLPGARRNGTGTRDETRCGGRERRCVGQPRR